MAAALRHGNTVISEKETAMKGDIMNNLIKKYRRAKGFTLVELLIVVVIIGILAGIMMLTTGSATDKAEAAKIIANLRGLKSAAVMRYADQNEWAGVIADLDEYVDQNIGETDGYSISADDDSEGHRYLTYDGASLSTGVREKLRMMAQDAGLKAGSTSADYAGGDTVGIVVK